MHTPKPNLFLRTAKYLGPTVLAGAIVWFAFRQGRVGQPYAPAFALWTHLLTALLCVPLGAWVLYGAKGSATHKLLGRVWALLMFVTATASLFLQHRGGFSFIHVLIAPARFICDRFRPFPMESGTTS